MLGLAEQQLVSIARVLLARPRFAFLEHPGRTLDPTRLGSDLRALAERSITYVTVGDGDAAVAYYDAVLDLEHTGRWRWTPLRAEGVTG